MFWAKIACGLDAETTAPVRLAPELERQAEDTIRVAQVMMNQQQQQQSGAQEQ